MDTQIRNLIILLLVIVIPIITVAIFDIVIPEWLIWLAMVLIVIASVLALLDPGSRKRP